MWITKRNCFKLTNFVQIVGKMHQKLALSTAKYTELVRLLTLLYQRSIYTVHEKNKYSFLIITIW